MKSAYGGSVKNSVETAQATGAKAFANKNALVRFLVFLWASMKVTVFMPSVNPCATTAIATIMPTAGSIWKPNPMPMPSRKLCPMSAEDESAQTWGWWWCA